MRRNRLASPTSMPRSPNPASGGSGTVLADDGNRAHVLMREPAQIVHEAAHRLLLALPRAGASLHLQIDLVDHAQARCADGMAEAFEPAIDLAWHLAVGVVEAVEHVFDGAAFGRDIEILHGDQLGDGEAVMR